MFEVEERATPKTPYEFAEWRRGKVQVKYHVTVDRINYSVPYQYSRQEVDILLTMEKVEIYCNGLLIAPHKRMKRRSNQYSTKVDYMSEKHKTGRLEKACSQVLSGGARVSYRTVKTFYDSIKVSGRPTAGSPEAKTGDAFIRGSEYYSRGNQ